MIQKAINKGGRVDATYIQSLDCGELSNGQEAKNS